ncbi:MAG: FHA domain-containing protein [Phycisphaerales bacterium]|nr:MAG: FHA domain-containing protein [Phycisphaerales bacterium]
MTRKLDPYSRLLGLPPGPRPPHLYALLGLEPFCDDVAAIKQASLHQMACIKPYEDHPDPSFRAMVQEIMNQIGLARAVLRDPEKKAEYDRRLAEILQTSVPEKAPPTPEEVQAAPQPSRRTDPSADTGLNLQAPPAAPSGQRALILNIVEAISGSSNTVKLDPRKESILGRNENCDVCIEHASVSPRHARFTYRQGRWYISREDRLAEIMVNGQKCTQALLSDGDTVTVGAYEIHVAF